MANKKTLKIAVLCLSDQRIQDAGDLAETLSLPLVTSDRDEYDIFLVLTPDRLELRQSGPQSPGAVTVNFSSGHLHFRRLFGGGRKQSLAKAIGLKHNRCPTVLDATGGLGRDSFILAAMGCKVVIIERSSIIAALLRDGIKRGYNIPEIQPVIDRLTLLEGDTRTITKLPQQPDIIYLDPMYPHRTKSALVKKEMRLLRAIVGDDEDSADLLEWALAQQVERIVVKRPKGAPAVEGPEPAFVIKSKNSRFDVYKKF